MVRSVVKGGVSQAGAAYQFNTTAKTVAKWVKGFREEGVEGLRDRSCLGQPALSATITSMMLEGNATIRISGQIGPGDADLFMRAVKGCR